MMNWLASKMMHSMYTLHDFKTLMWVWHPSSMVPLNGIVSQHSHWEEKPYKRWRQPSHPSEGAIDSLVSQVAICVVSFPPFRPLYSYAAPPPCILDYNKADEGLWGVSGELWDSWQILRNSWTWPRQPDWWKQDDMLVEGVRTTNKNTCNSVLLILL